MPATKLLVPLSLTGVVIAALAKHPLSPTAWQRVVLPEKHPAFSTMFPGTPKEDKRANHHQTDLRQRQPNIQSLRIESNQGSKDDKENSQIPEGFSTSP